MITEISKQAAKTLEEKLLAGAERIESAMVEHEEAQSERDTPTPFSISFSIKLDLAKNSATYKLGFSTRYSDETSQPLPDKAQLGLFDKQDDGGEE